jgi:2-succinyl-6-hydroxy-2,4-cyclohexadiene-1-carboxylate synthase
VLSTKRWGKGDPVVLVHGFTQSAGAWAPLAERLAAFHTVIAVDAPGHGDSAAVEANLPDGAAMIGEAGGAGSFIGYSMGGRFALHLALAAPQLVHRLVLVSATAGIDDPAERAARRASDELIAQRIEHDGVEPFVRWWLSLPLFSTLPPSAAAVDSRLGGTAAGLASSLRLAGTGAQQPLWHRLGELSMPVLVMAGALDGAYRARAERIVAGIGANAELAVIDGAGHAVHLERPDAWLAVVGPWLRERSLPRRGP